MVAWQIKDNPAFSPSVDTDRPGLSYTADSLEQLREELGDRKQRHWLHCRQRFAPGYCEVARTGALNRLVMTKWCAAALPSTQPWPLEANCWALLWLSIG